MATIRVGDIELIDIPETVALSVQMHLAEQAKEGRILFIWADRKDIDGRKTAVSVRITPTTPVMISYEKDLSGVVTEAKEDVVFFDNHRLMGSRIEDFGVLWLRTLDIDGFLHLFQTSES